MNAAGFAQAIAGSLTHDIRLSHRALRRERAYFEKVRRADISYGIQLRKIAKHVGDIISGFITGDPAVIPTLVETLNRYAHIITPWAQHTAHKMLVDVNRREQQAWVKTSQVIGTELRREVETAPIGQVVQQLLRDQVHLITSLPIQAGEQAQALALQTTLSGTRYADIIEQIQDLGNLTTSRATLIARTEVAKAHSALTEVRAKHIGSTHYIWHTANDYKVREMHKKLKGTIQDWNNPPVAELNGEQHHPGMFPNCRCWAEPLLPSKFV